MHLLRRDPGKHSRNPTNNPVTKNCNVTPLRTAARELVAQVIAILQRSAKRSRLAPRRGPKLLVVEQEILMPPSLEGNVGRGRLTRLLLRQGACRVCLRHAGFSLEYLRWVMVGKADRLLAQSSWE